MAKTSDYLWITLAYGVALLVAWLVAAELSAYELLWRTTAADFASTIVIFAFACAFRNASFYDAYWSVAPPVILLYWITLYQAFDLRTMLLFLLVLLWAIRLTHNWARGWYGLAHQDWRYVDLKAKTGTFYPLVNLFGIQLMPTVLVFVACMPVLLALQSAPVALSLLDALWIIIGYAALWIEWRADNVLRDHRTNPDNQDSVLRSNVWGWCRHPNYLGE